MMNSRHVNGTWTARNRRTVASCAALIAGLVLLQAGAASASTFSVNPTQVMLSGDARSALVSLKNESDKPVRFQVSVSAWAQSPDGQMVLTPTQDIVFFPALLTLKAHEERKVRVGTTISPSSVEKTYRLFIEELPPLESAETTTGVAMLTKMGIPVFLRPSKPTSMGAVADLGLKAGHVTFRLENRGNTFFIPQGVHVKGLTAAGAAAFEAQPTAWYILAGGSRSFDVDVPAAQCAQVRSVLVETQVSGTTIKETLQTPAGACK